MDISTDECSSLGPSWIRRAMQMQAQAGIVNQDSSRHIGNGVPGQQHFIMCRNHFSKGDCRTQFQSTGKRSPKNLHEPQMMEAETRSILQGYAGRSYMVSFDRLHDSMDSEP
jgi:hypothetical protein